MTVFSLGIVRGLIYGVVGAGVAMGLTVLGRSLAGMAPWRAGPVATIGILVGLLAYLTGLGAFTSWAKWVARGAEDTEAAHGGGRANPGWARYFSFTTNHKVIGVQYMVTSLAFMLVAGLFGLLLRLELAAPGQTIMGLGAYNSIMSLHGMTMIAVILIGIGGPINYLLPLMIGARDMAFPRLNALSFWIVPPAGILLLLSLAVGGFDTGWTAYPPLSLKGPLGMQFMLLAFYLVGWSSILGSVNFLTTIFKMRAPGMSPFRMPIFVWAVLATAILQLLFTQFVGISLLMVILERLMGLGFFTPEKGGKVLLFQHFFWFYSHPAVYIFVLPGLGIISEILPVMARKPLFGYKAVALSSLGISIGGTIVWGHHMFAAGMAEWLRVPIMFTTLLVAVPTGVKIFSWLATLWMGKLHLETPLLFVLTAIAVFLVGGLTGVPNGLIPTDLMLHDTYWVVGHFHHTMFGGFTFPMMAAIYFWFPKVTGRRLGEGLGKVHWGLMTVGFFTLYLPMFWLGLQGMRRRIADYDPSLFPANLVASIGGFLVGISILLLVINLIYSARRGAAVGANPWRSRTLEWQVSSPPPEENFPRPPRVVGWPYGYGTPGSTHAVVSPAGGSSEKGGPG